MVAVALSTAALTAVVWTVLVVKLRVPARSAALFSGGAGAVTAAAGSVLAEAADLDPVWNLGVLTLLYGVLLITAMLINFFRDPERRDPDDPDALVSPADGTVIYVKRIEGGAVPVSEKKGRSFPLTELVETELLGKTALLVGIEMSIVNVHVNRAPAAGTVIHLQHIPGAFLSLRHEEAPFRNERCTTVIDTGSCLIGVVQIASRLVRRIVSYVRAGDTVGRGQRIGMIRFGSQVDVVIPDNAGMTVAVKPGDTVTAGETRIAVVADSRKRN
ncbi:phosphatidylserine decarboxylase [bacterium]|nr:phosphatidylserine decarboxylase [bacterium]